jgi:site-specific recombinase XerD
LKFHKDVTYEQLTLADLNAFLESLSSFASNSQRLAKAALIWFYELVLQIKTKSCVRQVTEVRGRRSLSILSETEIRSLLAKLPQPYKAMASLMYGSGLTLSECVALRLRDIDYDNFRVLIWTAKGKIERETILPKYLAGDLKTILAEKYSGENLSEDCLLFPGRILKNNDSQSPTKQHLNRRTVQVALKTASKLAGLTEGATCMMLRHSFAVHLLEKGTHLKTVQRLLGHARIEQTTVYEQLLRENPRPPVSPLDALFDHEI